MTLSTLDRHYMDQRETLTQVERDFIDNCFHLLYDNAKRLRVPTAKDDRAASLEAAFIRFVIESREPV